MAHEQHQVADWLTALQGVSHWTFWQFARQYKTAGEFYPDRYGLERAARRGDPAALKQLEAWMKYTALRNLKGS